MPRIPVTTKCRQQTADRIQNIDCRLQSGYKMQTKNLKSFYVWYIITCHLTAYRASRNRFSAISLHDYLHYCGIFLAHFLMKIDRNIISSLHIVFSLCARVVGVMSVQIFCRCKCKRGVTVEYLTRATFEKQLTAFHVVLIIIFLSSVCFNFVDKNADRDQNCSFD